MSTFIIFIFGICLGMGIHAKTDVFLPLIVRYQTTAICKKFTCKKNEFTYYLEDNEGYYIVSLQDQEFRVKFSMNKPFKIVYCQEVERIS